MVKVQSVCNKWPNPRLFRNPYDFRLVYHHLTSLIKAVASNSLFTRERCFISERDSRKSCYFDKRSSDGVIIIIITLIIQTSICNSSTLLTLIMKNITNLDYIPVQTDMKSSTTFRFMCFCLLTLIIEWSSPIIILLGQTEYYFENIKLTRLIHGGWHLWFQRR
jgi:hypothetical protein